MKNMIKLIICVIMAISLFGCNDVEEVEVKDSVEEVKENEETIDESTQETISYPRTLNEEELYNWIEEYRGSWSWKTGKCDSSSMCMDGNNSIELYIRHSDSKDYEQAYNIYQFTGCCNDGISYTISSIDQISDDTYEVHLDQYVIDLPEDAGRSFQNYTLLPTDTYVIRKEIDGNSFMMQFKGLNNKTYKTFPDGEYMSDYQELYLEPDEWYEFKFLRRD